MAASVPVQDHRPEEAARLSPAILTKGFRPFFFLAALYAIAIVPLWLFVIAGVARPSAYLAPIAWHAHEMIFGFAVAVIAGFLLTAVGNWTKRETAVGGSLFALAALWTAGRVAMVFAETLPRGLPALVDGMFLPVLAATLARPLFAAKSRRNYLLLGALAALFVANLVVHLEALGALPFGAARHACALGVDLVVLIVLVIAGRVIPMFTKNATGLTSVRSQPLLDRFSIAAMLVVVVLDLVAPETRIAGAAAGLTGLLAAARALHWGARSTWRIPLLWILHTGYAWLAFGLVLRAVAAFVPAVPAPLATHALTVGAIGSLTLGMMARVGLGHTGRPLVAARTTAWAFVAMTCAALARVIVPLVAPSAYFDALLVAGAAWTLAFCMYLFVYTPILFAPRADDAHGALAR